MKSLTLLQLFQKGGPLMYPIAACSILALAIFCERLVCFYRVRRHNQGLWAQVDSLVEQQRCEEALAVCQRYNSPLARLFATALQRRGNRREQIKEVVEEHGRRETAPLERYLGLMGTTATISPLLGLLGTVLGMIRAFTVMAQEGTGSPATLGAGISEALLTTASGLTVAIPTILLHRYLTGRVDRISLEWEQAALQLVDRLGE